MADITINITDVVKSNNVKTFSNKTMSYKQNNITTHTSGVTGYQGYAMQLGHQAINPADSTAYFIGSKFEIPPNTTENNVKFGIPKTGTIKAMSVYQRMTGVAGTSETSTIEASVNGSLTTITTTFANNVNNTQTLYTGLNIAVVQGDLFALKWTTPAWATNPTGFNSMISIYLE